MWLNGGMCKSESALENETHKILWEFKIQTDHLILTKRQDLELINKQKSCYQVDFAFRADHRRKITKSENLAKELKHLWDMRVTVIPTVVSAHGTIPKNFEKRLEE